jgi:hypothetical protein
MHCAEVIEPAEAGPLARAVHEIESHPSPFGWPARVVEAH